MTLRVLVVDDSRVVCRQLASLLKGDPCLTVAACAHDGPTAVRLTKELRPDVVTLDVEMPGMSGLAVLEAVMCDAPTPVVMVAGVGRRAAEIALEAIHSGAVDFVLKYTLDEDRDVDALAIELRAKVKAAARVKVVRSLRSSADPARPAAPSPATHSVEAVAAAALRRPSPRVSPGAQAAAQAAHSADDVSSGRGAEWSGAASVEWRRRGTCPRVAAVGASTGGPAALRELLEELPPDFDAAVVVVQHMPAAFTKVLAAQLGRRIALPVCEAVHDQPLLPGRVYICPGDFHLTTRPNLRLELSGGEKVNGYRPSVDVMLHAAAEVFGPNVLGVLLTGMGEDGVAGMASVRARGGRTFAQSAESCVVDGMPQRAIERGVVDVVGTPAELGRLVAEWGAMHVRT